MSDFEKLKNIYAEIIKLDKAKLKYQDSITGLQTLDIQKTNKNDIQKILQDISLYLNEADGINKISQDNQNETNIHNRSRFNKYINRFNIGDEAINIDLSTKETTMDTLLSLCFVSNKYTKWLCERAIEGRAYNSQFLYDTIKQMKKVYINSNINELRRKDETEELRKLVRDIKDDIRLNRYIEAKKIIGDKTAEQFVKSLYSELKPIFNVENILYTIKQNLCSQIIPILIKDNYNTFKNWGFKEDDNGNSTIWLLSVDPINSLDRFAFHMPQLEKIVNGEIISLIATSQKENRKWKDTNNINDSVKKNNLDKINIKNNIHSRFDDDEIIQKDISDAILGATSLFKQNNKNNITPTEWIYAKILGEEGLKTIIHNNPELKERCEKFIEMLFVERTKENEATIEKANNNITLYKQKQLKTIEQYMKNAKNKKIYIQRRRKS